MQSILDGIVQIYKLLAVIPFIPLLVIWLIASLLWKDSSRAFKLSMDVTTALLIMAVGLMYNKVLNSGFGFYAILLFFLLMGGLIGSAQSRLKGTVDLAKLSRAAWRIGFFVLSFCYIVFLFIGIGQNLFQV